MTINTTMRFLADIKNNSDSDVAAATRSLEGRRLHIFAGSSRDAMNDITQQEIGKLEDTLAIYEPRRTARARARAGHSAAPATYRACPRHGKNERISLAISPVPR